MTQNQTKIIGIDKAKTQADLATASIALRQLEVIDPSAIICLEYRILVKIMGVEGLTSGGIFKPDTAIEKELFGKCAAEIICMGEEAFTLADGSPMANRPKVGDRVMVAKYSGVTVRDEDYNLYRLANDKDVAAIIKGDAV